MSRRYADDTGLNASSMTIAAGEFVSILGPSGCGKSTLLRCIAGLETPQSGQIRFGEKTVFNAATNTQLTPRQRRIGMVFQDLALWPHLSVRENVAFPLRVSGQAAQVTQRVGDVLALVGLSSFADKLPHQLSGGQQQRVAIARALVGEPDVLLMDEPLSALDAALKVQLRSEIKALTEELGVTTVFVTHDQEEAMSLSDRIAVLFAGHVRQFSTPEELYETPADPAVAEFVGTFNRLPDSHAPGVHGVRPEHIEIHTPGSPEAPAAPAAPAALAFEADVIGCDYRGGGYMVTARVAGAESPWLIPSPLFAAPRERLSLRVRPDAVLSFEPST